MAERVGPMPDENEADATHFTVAVPDASKPPLPKVPPRMGRVVVADSDAPHRKKLAVMLRNHGYTALEAYDGPTAVRMIRLTQPDAAIVDVNLDGHSGFHVIKQIRDTLTHEHHDVWQVPFLLIAATPYGRDKQYAMSLGASGYFAKPLVPAEFCPRLKKAIENYRGA
jgi:DNA-binding response OmpR family regulator